MSNPFYGEPDLFYCNIAKAYCSDTRKYGEWIFTGRRNVYGAFEIECSVCHNKLMVSPKRWEVGENFCDICGSHNKKKLEER